MKNLLSLKHKTIKLFRNTKSWFKPLSQKIHLKVITSQCCSFSIHFTSFMLYLMTYKCDDFLCINYCKTLLYYWFINREQKSKYWEFCNYFDLALISFYWSTRMQWAVLAIANNIHFHDLLWMLWNRRLLSLYTPFPSWKSSYIEISSYMRDEFRFFPLNFSLVSFCLLFFMLFWRLWEGNDTFSSE